MIRRSTLVFLTCLAALSVPAIQAKGTPSAMAEEGALQTSSLPTGSSRILLAQASGSSENGPLGLGSRGEPVRALQTRLKQIDYYDGNVDGLYGLATQRAVVAFQADESLDQTGSMNEETWLRIQAVSSQNEAAGDTASEVVTEDSVAVDAPPTTGSDVSQPSTAPTASELPPVGSSETASVAAAEAESGGGLGKVFGLSLGLIALLSSFGVGFYLANRAKSEPAEGNDDWANAGVNSSTRSHDSQLNSQLNGSSETLPQANSSATPVFSEEGVLNAGEGLARSNGAARNGGSAAITAATSGGISSGQMGGTAPLAQVDIIEGLIGDLRNPDPTKRRKAIWELGQRGNSLAMQPLVDSMVNADSKEKSLVLAALSEIGIRSLKPMSRALAIALQDDNPEVRKNGIRDLTRVYELVVQISQMLNHATEDEDPEVRQTAAWALDNLSRIRRSQDLDSTVRSFTSSGSGATPIDLLSSEASIRRNS